jgi:hypothetical protein
MTDIEESNYFSAPYPQISENTTPEFNEKIWERREFHSADLDSMSLNQLRRHALDIGAKAKGVKEATTRDKALELIKKTGDNLKSHQRLVTRYNSPVTPYDEILLFHAMGTGKTRSALSIAENALTANAFAPIQRVVVIGSTARFVRDNFTRELEKMKEKQLNKDKLNENELADLARHIKNYYIFLSYEKIAGKNGVVTTSTLKNIYKRYNNSVIIIDEVHNLVPSDEDSASEKRLKKERYTRFNKFLKTSTLPNRKVVLLSGTPMINSHTDFIYVLNLALPVGLELSTKLTLSELKSALPDRVRGRVSFLKESILGGEMPKVVFEGSVVSPMTHFKLTYLAMSKFQTNAYNKVAKSDKGAFDTKLQRVSLFAFPGEGGVRPWTNTKGVPTKEFYRQVKTIEQVCECSCKFAEVIKAAETGPWPIYVYCRIVGGVAGNKKAINTAGLKLLSLILEKNFGYSRFKSTSRGHKKRLLYFDSLEKPKKKALELFNKKGLNSNGQMCRIVLGSRVSSEGYTFNNIKREIVLTPHHHYTEIAQALARGVRVNAHDTTGEGSGTVKISRLVAVPGAGGECGKQLNLAKVDIEKVVDARLYRRSEKKDVLIMDIERVVMLNAFDCAFNFENNSRENGVDGSRDCEYGQCAYSCVGVPNPRVAPTNMTMYGFDKYYAGQKRLKPFFVRKNSIDIKSDDIDMLRSVAFSIQNNTIVSYRNGKPCYLSNWKNKVYLTHSLINPIGPAAESSVYRIENPVVVNGHDYTKDARIAQSANLIKRCFQNPTLFMAKYNYRCGNCRNISTLPLQVQEELLESAKAYTGSDEIKKRLSEKILFYYMPAMFVINFSMTVSALLYTFVPNGKLRVWNGQSWSNATENIRAAYDAHVESRQLEIQNSGESMGTYNFKTCSFCIAQGGEKSTAANKLKIGRVATTFSLKELANIFAAEKLFPWNNVEEVIQFPWLGGSKQTMATSSSKNVDAKLKKFKKSLTKESSLTKLSDIQLAQLIRRNKYELAGWLLLAWKKKNKVFLDTNCGTTGKERKKLLQ